MTTAYIENAASTAGKEFAKALAKFQAALPQIDLDGTNPHFKSKYATLGNVTKIVLPALAENGFVFTAGSHVENGTLILDAKLLHSSGEYETASFPITETQPQKVGSAVTYYRRYALASLTGVVADADDDGNATAQQAPAPLRNAQARKTPEKQPEKRMDALQSPFRKKVTSEWIDKGKVSKEDAIKLAGEVKKETGLDGDAMYEEVLKRLEAGSNG